MRLAVLNINQSSALRLGLDLTDIAIIDWLTSFSASGRMEHKEQDGVNYFWVAYKKLCEDLPVLGIGERQAARRINALIDKGIFGAIKVASKRGLKVYIRVIPDAYDELYSSDEAMSHRSDMDTDPCHTEVTCPCHTEVTCSYTLSKERDITDNTLIDSIGAEAKSNGTNTSNNDPVFVSLPCRKGVRSKETSYDVKESEIRDMQEAFPAVDVRQQYRQMGVWLNANKERIKTYDGMKNFICKWLTREQDKGWRSSKKSAAMTANSSFDQVAGGEISL